ncbi:MAG TPA: CocE/NonD family hydrolase [Candidatus Thermoplasmatota archaeon]|nr:CocE/NonD family hydrolase [Candidatus Thermoplasmatota archaeon]
MQGKPLALPLVAVLLLAGCAAPGADVDAAAGAAAGPFEPLTEDVFGFGDLLAAKVPSFDGVQIHVDVQLPDGDGPFPVLVEYTPYSSTLNPNRELWGNGLAQHALASYYVPKGYAFAIAHVRGSGQSGGCFTTGGPEEAQDGYALVEWLAAQPWSSGKVALMGTSYVGTTPISTATLAPPHLTTIVPVAAVTEWYRYYFENGEPRLFGELPFGVVYTDHPLWAATGLVPKPRNPLGVDPASVRCGMAQMQNAWLQDDYNDYWMARNYVKDIANATAPMLYAHGFLDENTATSLVTAFYDAYPGEKRMWLQQHGHGVPGSFRAYHEYVHRWLDHFMLGRDNGALLLPSVVLQDDRGQYHVQADWPPRNASIRLLHLGAGTLAATAPADGTARYRADTENLTFWTEPLAEDLHVTGAPRVELVAASDATDTQWDVQLYAVDDDGWHFVTRGYLDARHRASLQRGVDVVPGEESLYVVTMHGRDVHVAAGQRLVLVVASVDPYVVPDAPGATNTLRLGPAGSRLALPVLEDATFADAPPAPWDERSA